MISLILGQPGGGKSYEACVFHILPWLRAGRRVITNVPVYPEQFAAIVGPQVHQLLELRTTSVVEGSHVFSVPADFNDPWTDPVTNVGPIYVIDECHKQYPRQGTDKLVLEFYAEHRHAGIDVLLITQAYGKLNADLRDLVQVVYRCKKMTSFGKPDAYIRKVTDGVRGGLISVEERQYEKQFFKLYKSHTAKSMSVQEAHGQDIKPGWWRWKTASRFVFALGALMLGYAAWSLYHRSGRQPAAPVPAAAVGGTRAPARGVPQPMPVGAPTFAPEQLVTQPPAPHHPFDGMGFSIVATVSSPDRVLYAIALTQNGQAVAQVTSRQLADSGYSIRPMGDCAAEITYPGQPAIYARCDTPQQQMAALPRRAS